MEIAFCTIIGLLRSGKPTLVYSIVDVFVNQPIQFINLSSKILRAEVHLGPFTDVKIVQHTHDFAAFVADCLPQFLVHQKGRGAPPCVVRFHGHVDASQIPGSKHWISTLEDPSASRRFFGIVEHVGDRDVWMKIPECEHELHAVTPWARISHIEVIPSALHGELRICSRHDNLVKRVLGPFVAPILLLRRQFLHEREPDPIPCRFRSMHDPSLWQDTTTPFQEIDSFEHRFRPVVGSPVGPPSSHRPFPSLSFFTRPPFPSPSHLTGPRGDAHGACRTSNVT
mmetsp:Transcript_1237/g.8136  ORF Transcript_1237/g.8136 Transcript_1237/m.8136 type:complete len:283 (-) Transcript_1237:16-864(-)